MVEDISRKSVLLIGAGTQGRRLAYMWSREGGAVCLIDPQAQQLQDATKYIDQLRASSKAPSKNYGSVTTASPDELQDALASSWLVIECIPENPKLKRSMISRIDDLAPYNTIIASNSSSYAISEIIEGLELKNKARILSAHSYWPPETSSLEIMGHSETDPALISLLMNQSAQVGFSPFHVKSNSIGYIYNRIWAAIKREALLVLSEGVASPEEVDSLFKDVLKTPKGPCEQMDVVGLDVVLDIERHYAESRSGIPKAPRDFLEKMIEDGRLGQKNGRGFYDYDADKANGTGETNGINSTNGHEEN